MAEITINGVKYTNVPNKKAGTKFAASLTQSNIGASQAVQDYVNSAYFYPLVNAIDINWNGVEVDENSYINTTSDLISYIASKESNVDLSSYATMTYVNDKISEVIGGAPETLDTLKELADALEDDASLAYVTQALDGKADKSSLTNYATNSYVTTELDKKADKSQLPDMNNYSTVSYVTTELDKKANKSEIPAAPDLTPYVTYTQANSYYAAKDDIVQPDLYEMDSTAKSYILHNPFVGSGTSFNFCMYPNILSGTNRGNILTSDNYVGGKHYNIIGGCYNASYANNALIIGEHNVARTENSLVIGQFSTNESSSLFVVGNGRNEDTRRNAFRIDTNAYIHISDTKTGTPYVLQKRLNGKADLSYVTTELANKANLSDIPVAPDLTPYATVSYVTTELDKKANVSDIPTMPDMTQYVTTSSYNALYEEVQHLAYLISYYHPIKLNIPATPKEGYTFDSTHGGQTSTKTLIDIDEDDNTKDYWDNNLWSATSSNNDFSVSFLELASKTQKVGTNVKFNITLPQATNNDQSTNITVNFAGSNDYNAETWTIPITLNAIQTPTPTCYWTLNGTDWGPDGQGDTSWTVGEPSRTFTFRGNPASGWTFNYPTGTGITADTTTGDITIDTSVMTSKGTYTFTASYAGDSTYASATKTFTVTIGKLASASWKDSNDVSYSVQYETNKNDNPTTLTFNGTPLTGWTFNDNATPGISIDSSGNITIEPAEMSANQYWISAEYPEDAVYSDTYQSFAIIVHDNE